MLSLSVLVLVLVMIQLLSVIIIHIVTIMVIIIKNRHYPYCSNCHPPSPPSFTFLPHLFPLHPPPPFPSPFPSPSSLTFPTSSSLTLFTNLSLAILSPSPFPRPPLSLTTATPSRDEEEGFSKCTYYDHNYTALASYLSGDTWQPEDLEEHLSNNTKTCTSWVFDDSVFQSTLVSEVRRLGVGEGG